MTNRQGPNLKRSRLRTPELQSGVRPDSMDVYESLYDTCLTHVENIFRAAGVPESHGKSHVRRVAEVCERTLARHHPDLDPLTKAALMCAALLHEVDDRKYFSKEAKAGNYPNARKILKALALYVEEENRPHYVETAISAIAMTSVYKTGVVISHCPDRPWLAYVRYADQLQSIEPVGVYRCLLYSVEQGRPLYDSKTPVPDTASKSRVEACLELATPERLDHYRKGEGKSCTMLDHYFDKLIQVAHGLSKVDIPEIAESAKAGLEVLARVACAPRPNGLAKELYKAIGTFSLERFNSPALTEVDKLVYSPGATMEERRYLTSEGCRLFARNYGGLLALNDYLEGEEKMTWGEIATAGIARLALTNFPFHYLLYAEDEVKEKFKFRVRVEDFGGGSVPLPWANSQSNTELEERLEECAKRNLDPALAFVKFNANNSLVEIHSPASLKVKSPHIAHALGKLNWWPGSPTACEEGFYIPSTKSELLKS